MTDGFLKESNLLRIPIMLPNNNPKTGINAPLIIAIKRPGIIQYFSFPRYLNKESLFSDVFSVDSLTTLSVILKDR